MAKQKYFRVVFNEDDDLKLWEYLSKKTSGSGFMKDLARREMEKDEFYIQRDAINNKTKTEHIEQSKENEEFDFDINDLD